MAQNIVRNDHLVPILPRMWGRMVCCAAREDHTKANPGVRITPKACRPERGCAIRVAPSWTLLRVRFHGNLEPGKRAYPLPARRCPRFHCGGSGVNLRPVVRQA